MYPEIAYILGSLRDGCFTENKKYHIYRIRFYQKNKAWLLNLSNIIEKIFGKKPTITLDKRDNVWCLILNSKPIYTEIKKISEYPGNQKAWIIPSWIMNSSQDVKKSYVKGFFDSEGGITKVDKKTFKPKDIRIYFCQANKKCLVQLRSLIESENIKCGIISGPYFKKGYKYPVYGFRIHGVKQVIKFYKSIGTEHPEKINRFKIISDMSCSLGTP